jgi:hypothetical protein
VSKLEVGSVGIAWPVLQSLCRDCLSWFAARALLLLEGYNLVFPFTHVKLNAPLESLCVGQVIAKPLLDVARGLLDSVADGGTRAVVIELGIIQRP